MKLGQGAMGVVQGGRKAIIEGRTRSVRARWAGRRRYARKLFLEEPRPPPALGPIIVELHAVVLDAPEVLPVARHRVDVAQAARHRAARRSHR
jgi:hypothetical protein